MSKPDMSAVGIKREDYKAIKRMDRVQLSGYLQRVYRRGFEAGQKYAVEIKKSQSASKEAVEE